jgi:3-hydroxyisobutyrate dehydrogenase-like beta-hydroxyacid dehydrogenase
MRKIAFLGLGAMGSHMAQNLINAGHKVTVWNRDASKATALGHEKTRIAATPRAAALRADYVISMVRDDEASKHVWLDPETGALWGMPEGAVAIETSTLTVNWVQSLAKDLQHRGHALLDAPVVGSRPQAEAAQLSFLVGGSAEVVKRADSVLKAMGTTVHHAGLNGSGAAIKLAVNALLGIQVAAMAEVIGMLKATDLDLARAIGIIGSTPVVSPAMKNAAAGMLSGNFTPMFPVELVEKDFGYVNATAATHGRLVPMADAARAVMQMAMAQGHGSENLTAVVRLYL